MSRRNKGFCENLQKSFDVKGADGVRYRLKRLEKEGFLQKVSHGGTHTGWAIVAPQEGASCRNDNRPILENFKDTEVLIFKTPAGYVIPFMHVAKATGMSKPSITKMLQRNSELFKAFIVDVYDKNTKQTYKCLTRDGIIGYIIKISSGRLSGEVKQQVVAFQKWAIETLSVLLEQGAVEISSEEYEKNLMAIMGLSKESLQKIVAGLRKENIEPKE